MKPTIKYYALFKLLNNGTKTPKFSISKCCGYYPPMNELVGRDGKVSMYLMESSQSGSNEDAPPMKLQAKNSLNFTGLKDYFVDGRLSGFAWGCPYDSTTYKCKGKKAPNPFSNYRQDGFLFIIHTNENDSIVTCIELIVLDGAKILMPAYCKQLQMGGFNEEIQSLRELAKEA